MIETAYHLKVDANQYKSALSVSFASYIVARSAAHQYCIDLHLKPSDMSLSLLVGRHNGLETDNVERTLKFPAQRA